MQKLHSKHVVTSSGYYFTLVEAVSLSCQRNVFDLLITYYGNLTNDKKLALFYCSLCGNQFSWNITNENNDTQPLLFGNFVVTKQYKYLFICNKCGLINNDLTICNGAIVIIGKELFKELKQEFNNY